MDKQTETKLSKKQIAKITASVIITLVATMLFFLMLWIIDRYDDVKFDQILYQIKSPVAGTGGGLIGSALLRVVLLGTLVSCLEITVYFSLCGRFKKYLSKFAGYVKYSATRVASFFKKHHLPMAALLLVTSMLIFIFRLDVHVFLSDQLTGTEFFEKHYVDPDDTELKFPDKKRNLIYIFLESMESTFRDTSAGGNITEDLIPELSELADNNISFAGEDGIRGAVTYSGTAWTAAALVAQTSGVNVKVPLNFDSYGEDGKYMPGLTALGDILADAGYNQSVLFGSDAGFAARDVYFTEHGNHKIIDIYSLIENGTLPEGYWEWWGFEDLKLFEEAKKELTLLSQSDKPFSFVTLTADTHFPAGYVCPNCPSDKDEQYSNVLACSSKQVYEFIEWCKAQPFYENTTIILSGDHLTMDPEFLEDIDEDYVRSVYNCIINSPTVPEKENGRAFSTLDMFPTTLAALGVEIEGDRLGLGVNLFSDKETLTEYYGEQRLADELAKKSQYYFDTFFETKKKAQR